MAQISLADQITGNTSVRLPRTNVMYNANRIAMDPSASLAGGMSPVDSQLPSEAMQSMEWNPIDIDTGAGGFDWKGAMGSFADIGSGIASLAGAYNAYKQLGMMEDQFNFAKASHNQNVANQAAITNDQLRKQAAAAAGQRGFKEGTQEYSDYMAANQVNVSGAPVG